MTEDTKKGLRHHIVAAARDIMVLGTLIVVIFGVIAQMTRIYWEPFADLPENVADIQREVAQVQSALTSDVFSPRIVDFQGRGIILPSQELEPGDTFRVLYNLRRNASCDTDVLPIFYDVDKNLSVTGPVTPAVKAPVTVSYILFPLRITLPPNIPPGRYVYAPEITPKKCGVYERIHVPPSDVFTVK